MTLAAAWNRLEGEGEVGRPAGRLKHGSRHYAVVVGTGSPSTSCESGWIQKLLLKVQFEDLLTDWLYEGNGEGKNDPRVSATLEGWQCH